MFAFANGFEVLVVWKQVLGSSDKVEAVCHFFDDSDHIAKHPDIANCVLCGVQDEQFCLSRW